MSLSKTDISIMVYRMKGKEAKDNNFGNFYLILNRLLYNCVLKGIISYEVLSLREKKILNKILEGSHKRMFFCEKIKQINIFPCGKVNEN